MCNYLGMTPAGEPCAGSPRALAGCAAVHFRAEDAAPFRLFHAQQSNHRCPPHASPMETTCACHSYASFPTAVSVPTVCSIHQPCMSKHRSMGLLGSHHMCANHQAGRTSLAEEARHMCV